MKNLEISKELRAEIEINQQQLKTAIRHHQKLVFKCKETCEEDVDLKAEITKAVEAIILIGLTQKTLFENLREEYKSHQKTAKTKELKNEIEDRRINLNNALNKAKKQTTISRSASSSLSSTSEDSVDNGSTAVVTPEKLFQPLTPHDLSQIEFLGYFNLITHDTCKELQNKRVERKRRSTANAHFLYNSKNWDFPPRKSKRQNNSYLLSSVSPPNTRQSVRKKNGTGSPPNLPNASQKDNAIASFPSISNLPNGLTIERVNSSSSSSPDIKTCIMCRQPGLLTICENCSNGFHISCHNRPLTTSPRQCPRCIVKEVRTVGALNVPSGISVFCVTSSDVTEKLNQKKELEDTNKTLSDQLTHLQNRHSQLTISLKNQKTQQEELLSSQQSTEDKIKQIVGFIERMKSDAATTEAAS